MVIQSIKSISFSGQKQTDKGNTYNTTSVGTIAGVATGIAAGAGLMKFQLKALKSMRGKRNLISGYHDRGISLSDISEHKPERDDMGKIIPYKKGISNRTRKIVNEFKMNLFSWGAGILALTTGIGRLVDSNINETKAKRADEKAGV